MRKWQTSLCCIRQQVSFSHGYISLSNILTNRQSIGDAGRRRFVIRLPLKEQWDCVWLLLADHNTMKKELLRGTNDTSPYEWHHFPSKVSSKDKHIGEGNISKKRKQKSDLKSLPISQTRGEWEDEPSLEKCSRICGMSVKKRNGRFSGKGR